jgi:hypothetical protein
MASSLQQHFGDQSDKHTITPSFIDPINKSNATPRQYAHILFAVR